MIPGLCRHREGGAGAPGVPLEGSRAPKRERRSGRKGIPEILFPILETGVSRRRLVPAGSLRQETRGRFEEGKTRA